MISSILFEKINFRWVLQLAPHVNEHYRSVFLEVWKTSNIKVIRKVRRLGGARTASFGIMGHQMRIWEIYKNK